MRIAPHCFLALASTIALTHSTLAQASAKSDLSNARQMIIVVTKSWDDFHGMARPYERADIKHKWRPAGQSFAVVVGKNGLGWGRGFQPASVHDAGPIKQEGDGKAPAGIFSLTSSFGYSATNFASARMPYISLTPTVECVDDPQSSHYNQVLDLQATAKDWNSFEQMRRDDELYRWGVIVDYNMNPTRSRAGSCIFLHIWSGPDQGTAGCTAMEPNNIKALLRWLNPAKRPVLVQLTQSEYLHYQDTWSLPARP